MKAIMISIRPQWVAKILNGEKTIEIRKQIPSDYVGWYYVYVTKGGGKLRKVVDYDYDTMTWLQPRYEIINSKHCKHETLNGKVVARFWCDRVVDYVYGHKWSWKKGAPMWGADNSYEKILKDMCLTDEELRAYVDDLCFKAIHITKLEIFDKPKDISEFQGTCNKSCDANRLGVCSIKPNCNRPLTRAPQSYMFIEV